MRVAFVTVLLSSLGGAAGVALAEPPRIHVEVNPPAFYPENHFPFGGGYYRTDDGNYYHYDRDRRGWHYGRNHDEGMRWEREREHRGDWEGRPERHERD